mgnify:CR=1 FL=1
MLLILGNRQISISREISKKFEEVYRGTIEEVINQISDIKGEIVFLVEGNKEEKNYDDQVEGRNSVLELLESGKDINKIFITKGENI